MLFKFEPGVWIVAVAILAISPVVHSQTSTTTTQNPVPDFVKQVKECMDTFKKNGSPMTQDQCAEVIKSYYISLAQATKDGSDCGDAKKKYDDATKKFGKACGNFGLPKDPKECAEEVKSCKGSKDDEDTNICPTLKAADLNKKRDDAQKVQKEIADLKKELGKFDDKVAELTGESNKTAADLNKQLAKMQADYTREQANRKKEIQNGMNQQQKQVVNQIEQMQQEYDKLTIAMKQIPTQLAQAKLTNYDQKVTELRLQCHSQALQILQNKQAEVLAKIAKSQYTLGTLNNVVKTFGMTDEQRTEVLGMYYEHKCLNDSSYVTQVNLAHETARIAQGAILAQRDAMVQQQSRLIKNIGTFTAQSQWDRSLASQQAQTDEQAARQAYTTEAASLQQQLATVQNSTQAKLTALNNQKQTMNDEIAQRNSFLETKNAIVSATEKLSGNQDVSAKDVSEVNDGLADTNSSALAARRACCDGKDDSKVDPHCEDIMAYLSKSEDMAPISAPPKSAAAASGADGTRTPATTSTFPDPSSYSGDLNSIPPTENHGSLIDPNTNPSLQWGIKSTK